MDENKKPNEDQGFGEFNEDFDFGENNAEPHYLGGNGGRSKHGPNKNLLIGIFAVVVVGVGILGYKFFSGSAKTALAQSKYVPPSPTTPTPSPAPVTKAEAPKPEERAVAPKTVQPPAGTAKSPQEQNFGDLAQAFSTEPSANPPANAAATPSPTPAAPNAKEGTIQDLQKELFAPEVTPPVPSTAATTPPSGTQSPTGAPQPPSTAKAETKSVPPNAAAATAPATANETAEIAQLASSIHKLNQQIEYISNKIKYLDSYTREVSDNLSKFNETINSMDHRLSTLTNTTSTLSKDVGTVRSEVGHVREVLKEDGLELSPATVAPHRRKGPGDGKISIEEPEYILHAVIPGRAWLKSAKGQILTVTEGDTVGNYGKILVIDAANGVVLTSSGITFR